MQPSKTVYLNFFQLLSVHTEPVDKSSLITTYLPLYQGLNYNTYLSEYFLIFPSNPDLLNLGVLLLHALPLDELYIASCFFHFM